MEERTLRIRESQRIPRDGLLLGYAAVLPYPLAALAYCMVPPALAGAVMSSAIVWGAAILIFLSGVRRGLSFRTEGGPSLGQIAGAIGLFATGLAALDLPTNAALSLLLLGHLWLLARDPVAARRGEAPLYFTQLRPPQMSIAVVGIAALLALSLTL
jgi:hypothetical protein